MRCLRRLEKGVRVPRARVTGVGVGNQWLDLECFRKAHFLGWHNWEFKELLRVEPTGSSSILGDVHPGRDYGTPVKPDLQAW